MHRVFQIPPEQPEGWTTYPGLHPFVVQALACRQVHRVFQAPPEQPEGWTTYQGFIKPKGMVIMGRHAHIRVDRNAVPDADSNRYSILTKTDSKMNRRHFLTVCGAATLAPMIKSINAAESAPARDYYELRQFILETEAQKKGLDAFLKTAAIPALNRMGIQPVGVFYPSEGFSPLYLLLRYKSLEDMATLRQKVVQDQELQRLGAEHINAPADHPAYKRFESSLMLAFKGMPQIETPVKSPGRVFQLRTYESPSLKTNAKKIEMFNDAGEIKIFREVGLNPVFFGETLIGGKMPNLTYMLVFSSMDEQKAAWNKFGQHPDWKKLRAMPEYSDKAILCGITNLSLVAAEYSQV
jgi:hypothetical protein